MTCKQVAKLLSSEQLEREGTWRKLQARVHLWMCAHCRQLERQLRLMGDAGRRLAMDCDDETPADGPESIEERMKRKVLGD